MSTQNLKLIQDATATIYHISPNPCKRHKYETIDITDQFFHTIPESCRSPHTQCILKRCSICQTLKHVEYLGIDCQSIKVRSSTFNHQHTVIPTHNMFHHSLVVKPCGLYIGTYNNCNTYHIGVFVNYDVSCLSCSHSIAGFRLHTDIDYPSVRDYNEMLRVADIINDDEKLLSQPRSSNLFQVCYEIKLLFLSLFSQFSTLFPPYADIYNGDTVKSKCESITINYINSKIIFNHRPIFQYKSRVPDYMLFKLTPIDDASNDGTS